MKILLKILVAPFALALSLLAALLVFLFDICEPSQARQLQNLEPGSGKAETHWFTVVQKAD